MLSREQDRESVDPSPMNPPRVAAIDLGSNSFHMVLAHLRGGVPQVVDRIREQVQLAAGLDDERRIDAATCERALTALDLFAQRLGPRDDLLVRAVGTNTLRLAKNARDFMDEAERRLGAPIEVISGEEEARLVYLGVAHGVSPEGARRLVVDIGGGSTECIYGRDFDAQSTNSSRMGCISWTRRFFGDGKITRSRFESAVLAAQRDLHAVARALRDEDWDEAVGASGTIRATGEILRAGGLWDDGFDRAGLERIAAAMLDFDHVDDVSLKGLKPSRAPVYIGGLAVLTAVFESLGIEKMTVSPMALREGVIYDLLGRIRAEDVRERTIRDLESRFGVDGVQAARVEATALALLEGVSEAWDLGDPACTRALRWAIRLHEVGLSLAHDRFHRHGAYIVGNARMAGFSRDDQELLSALVLNQRRRLKREVFKGLSEAWRDRGPRLAVLLRLGILLNRSRRPATASTVRLTPRKKGITLHCDADWLERHPLTRLDLEEEANLLWQGGIRLEVSVD